jgi:hypothetical protein
VDESFKNFRSGVVAILGVTTDSDVKTLWNIVRQCAVESGVPLAGGLGVLGAAAGSVTVGALTVPGWVIGALAGMTYGTLACTGVKYPAYTQLVKADRQSTSHSVAELQRETKRLLRIARSQHPAVARG